MPNCCYVFIHASPGARVGLVKKGAPGWLITSVDQKEMSGADARKVVEVLNGVKGVNPEMADRMLAAAITGWRCPRYQLEGIAA
jgi:hypothetical protein